MGRERQASEHCEEVAVEVRVSKKGAKGGQRGGRAVQLETSIDP
jgi:hypothetical protein